MEKKKKINLSNLILLNKEYRYKSLAINLFAFIIFIIITCLFFSFLVTNFTSLGISYDWYNPQSLYSFSRSPLDSVWNNNDGVSGLGNNYLGWFYKLLFYLGFNNITTTILLIFLIFTFSGFNFYLLLKKISIPIWISILGGILYESAYQLYLLTYHGYLYYLISFAFTPPLIYLFLLYLGDKKLKVALIGALVFSLAASQFQFFIINALILLIFSIFHYKSWRSILKVLSVYLVINILLSSSWLYAYLLDIKFLSSLASDIREAAAKVFQHNTIMDLFHSPFVFWSIKEYLANIHLGWFYYFWRVSQILVFAIPLFVYSLFRNKITARLNRLFIISFTLLIAGMILAKGKVDPFAWTSDLFYKIPLFSSLFRDLNHFYYLITLSSILLFALSIFVLYENISIRRKKMFVFLLVLFAIIYTFPYTLNAYQSRLHQYQLSSEYNQLLERYNQDAYDYQLLWLPIGSYVKYNDDQDADTGMNYTGVNPLLSSVIQQDINEWDLPSRQNQPSLLRKVVQFGYGSRIKDGLARLLGLFNVKEVVHLKRDFSAAATKIDTKESYRSEEFWSAEQSAERFKNLGLIEKNDVYDVYQIKDSNFSPRIFVPQNISSIIGDTDNLLDGIALNQESSTVYIIGKDKQGVASNIILPVEFFEDSLNKFHHNTYQIITKINIPEEGDYHIYFYQKNQLNTSINFILKVKDVDLNNHRILMEKVDDSPEILKKTEMLDSGVIHLKNGDYDLVLSNTVNNSNLIINSSFEGGPWPGQSYNCFSSDSDIEIKSEIDRQHLLQFKNKGSPVCRNLVVGNLAPRQKYLFSYDIRNSSGSLPEVCLMLKDNDYCHGSAIIQDNHNWQHQELIYEQDDSEIAIISFSVPAGEKESVNSFDNFELRQVGLPESMAFVKEKDNQIANNIKVEYRKINPSKYRVILRQASGIVPLVFTENFNENWKAYFKEKEKNLSAYTGPDFISSEYNNSVQNDNLPQGALLETNKLQEIKKHDHINGLSNIWYVDAGQEAKDIEIVIEYSSQKMFVTGQYIAIITLVVILIYLIIVALKNLIISKKY